ncbi:creatininase family protein [Gramella sp. GC03-9]|uniref:Creatininase family protein n=1 Tax=Christiangramia oceanisediminis TaxID=2920386 RepID=A0A9X2L0J6_9FLAO|nr:creatininase family protein [Gramella oceanisediminis]MCP9201612.1 creatininase family protein [Gramella oceanisediminis]
MFKNLVFFLFISFSVFAQDIPHRWDELTASDWPEAIEKSNRTIILPIGILEKHGLHGPIGSDLIRARQWADRAAAEEYAVVFPDYFYGQVNEAKHIQGTFSLPSDLTMKLLEETCKEIARNGFNKILIVNTHGGNPYMLRYFVQNQMESPRDYVIYFYDPGSDQEYQERLSAMRNSDASGDMHGGERETSELLYLRPELVKQERATNESGVDQDRLSEIPNVYRSIWWYASFPNHYAGKGETGTKELGELVTSHHVGNIVEALKAIKKDTRTLELQKKYFEEMEASSKK